MEHIYHIRYEYYELGKSIRQIARETGHNRRTITQYLEKKDFNCPLPVKRHRSCRSDAYHETITRWLKEDMDAPKKQRHTARRVYHRLVEEAARKGEVFDLSERTICRWVALIRRELEQEEPVSLPLFHPPGGAQTDFGRTTFIENGIRYDGYHLGMAFPHSDAKFVQLFKGENADCLEQGLVDIFEYIGVVPHTLWFDNMATVVKAIKQEGERDVTDRFRRLQCHFDFKSNFCNPAAGHEKGSVENYIGYSRRNYFVPVPSFADLETYNRELLARCEADLDREHYKKERLVRDLFREEKKWMTPLPSYPYEACHYVPALTNHYGMVTYQTCRYSTAGHLRRREVTLKVGAHTVTVLDEAMRPVVTHKRLYGKNKESMLWGPYLRVLAKRPNAFCYSDFFQHLSEPLQDFLHARDRQDKKRILSELSAHSDALGFVDALDGLQRAMEMDPQDTDTLLAAYAFVLNRPGKIPKNEVPEHIPELADYTIDLGVYGALLGGVTCDRK